MNNHFLSNDPVTGPAPTDLSDSIDLRLLVTGRLTPTAIPSVLPAGTTASQISKPIESISR